MIPGQTILDGMRALGPWMARQADNLRVSFMKIDANGNSFSATIKVRTKNLDETGDGGTPLTPSITFTGNNTTDPQGTIKSADFAGLKEVFRFEYDGGTGTGTSWIQWMPLDFVWWDTPNW